MGSGLANVALGVGRSTNASTKGSQPANIIEFAESAWGIGMELYPVQRVILKVHYGLLLDDTKEFLVDTSWRLDKKVKFTEASYLRYLYDEGRSNIREVVPGKERREMVLSIGRRSGKCILGGSLVLTDKGILRIDSLGDKEGDEFQPLQVTVAQEGRTQSESKYFYNGGKKPCRILSTHCGYQLGGTDNHRIKIMGPEGVVDWKYLSDVTVGDKVAIHRNTDLWSQSYVDTKPFHNNRGYKEIEFPNRLDEKWGSLLGYLVGDGAWTRYNSVDITVEHPETWDYLKKVYCDLFGSYQVGMDKRTANTGCIRFHSIGMRVFLDDLGFCIKTKRDEKKVPWAIMQSPKSVVCAFLRGLFETDGGVSKNGKVVEFSTASEQLAREIQTLLLNLGIISRVRPKVVKEKTYWILTVLGLRSRRTFMDLVGFDSHKKMDTLVKGLDGKFMEEGYVESIPYQKPWTFKLLNSIPKSKKGWVRSRMSSVLGNIIKPSSNEDFTYSRMINALALSEELGGNQSVIEHFQHLLSIDYFYDSVEHIEESEPSVYDLTVPEGESFVANGFVNHNTALSACIAAYETYKLILKADPHSYYGIMPSNPIQIISIATDKDQAGILYQDVSGHFRACLAYETDIITDEGTKPIGSLVGTTQTILTRDGSWVEAPIRAFGVQPLFKITLRRQGIEKIVYATENHRWFARDARKAYRGKGFHEFLTSDLRPGKHHLQTTFGRSYKNRIIPSPFGVAHGFTFGDGHSPRNRNASYVDMFGEKDKALLSFFSMCPQKACERYQGNSKVNVNEGYIRTTALPNFFKDFPPIKENKSYLLGWLMGYFAADGTVSSGVEIASVDRKNLEFVRDVCILLGIGVFSIRGHTRISNITERPFTMYKLKFLRSTLDEDFFVIPHHKKAFLKLGGSNVKRNAMNWTVISVEPTARVEKVFCATVDKHRDFVLGGNLATGNCDFFGPYTANNTMSYARFQTPKDIDKYGRYSEDPTARASLRVTFRSCIAKGLRGAGNIVIIMDEAAHFTDGGQSSAASVYDAVTPSAATFSPKDQNDKKIPIGDVEGRVISISSPLGKQGHFYELYQLGYTGTTAATNMLCIQAPTWEVNPTLPLSEYEKFYYKDPVVFFTEFGGHFTDRTRGWLEREEDLLACVDNSLRPLTQAPARRPHFIGIDVGLVKDGSAVAIGHTERVNGSEKIVVDLVDQIKAGEGKYKDVSRLEFDQVADWVAKLSKKFYIVDGIFDQWAGIPFEQALIKRGLRQIKTVHMTRQINSDIFKNFKDAMWEKWLMLYDWPIPQDPGEGIHCPYIAQLLEMQAQYLSKYITLVQAPQVAGKHDDMVDALVRMVWTASHSLGTSKIISGVRNPNAIGGATGHRASRRARLNARRTGSSPDRQPSRVNRGCVRGRR